MEKIKIVDSFFLEKLSHEADISPRKRKNFNFHETSEDLMQRMLNALHPETYIRPHKHENPDKREGFILLSGEMALIIFDDYGLIKKVIHFDLKNIFIVEIPPSTWHALVALKENTVYYEIKDGPYSLDNDKQFASWSPDESASDAKKYLESLKNEVVLRINRP